MCMLLAESPGWFVAADVLPSNWQCGPAVMGLLVLRACGWGVGGGIVSSMGPGATARMKQKAGHRQEQCTVWAMHMGFPHSCWCDGQHATAGATASIIQQLVRRPA
jgi:hypothetical protein